MDQCKRHGGAKTGRPAEVNVSSTGVGTDSFSDPDGNSRLLQEVKERLPGRVWGD
jgi:hypothetical protein